MNVTNRGQLLTSCVFTLVSAVLLVLLPVETATVSRPKITEQPWFWPSIGLSLMFIFSISFSIVSALSWRTQEYSLIDECKVIQRWLRPLEFALWFLVYVSLVPTLGYLLSTILFSCALSARMGYRTRQQQLIMAGFGLFVVIFFKTLLQVNIPAGTIYNYLPSPLSAFMMSYF